MTLDHAIERLRVERLELLGRVEVIDAVLTALTPNPPAIAASSSAAAREAAFPALVDATRRLASIEVPSDANPGARVARTVYCNREVTAHDVRMAREALRLACEATGGAP